MRSSKDLYDKFIMRDLLSFVAPGAIVLLAVLLLWWPAPNVYNFFQNLHWWLLFIVFLPVTFIIGFAVQCFGEIVGCIWFSTFESPNKAKCTNRYRPLWRQWIGKAAEYEWWKKHLEEWKTFRKQQQQKDRDGEVERREAERLVVLTQMCANAFFAALFAGVAYLFSIVFRVPSPASWVLTVLYAFLLIVSLLWGHRVHMLKLSDFIKDP